MVRRSSPKPPETSKDSPKRKDTKRKSNKREGGSKPPEVTSDQRARRRGKSPEEKEAEQRGFGKQAMLSLGALGVCFGDLGTSEIYSLHTVFTSGNVNLAQNTINVLGILSLVFWTLVIIVSLKYLTFVLRADNRGEGGTFALISLLRPWRHMNRPRRHALVLVGLAGAAMLYAGATITPAISILSAVEGLKVASPGLGQFVLPVTVAILVIVFLVQRFGTAKIGLVFGPIMSLWFVAIAALGIYGIAHEPRVYLALSPLRAFRFFQHDHWTAFLILFAVFLVTTGAEALYADIGHFGRKPIRRMWFFVVLPALLLNYFGQGAMLLHDPKTAAQPFFHVVPPFLLFPVVALATIATIIASQAVITGAFSMTRQAARQGMIPRSRVIQTSEETSGQIYVPAINWVLMAATIIVVLLFRTSDALASAYGISVSTTMVVTTILAFFVARERGHWPLWGALLFLIGFGIVDLAYFGSNVLRIPHGGWFPIIVAVLFFIVMSTWRRGGEILAGQTDKEAKPIEQLVQDLKRDKVARVPGTAIFLTPRLQNTPPALNHHIERNRSLKKQVVLLTILTEDVPRTTSKERIELKDLQDGFFRIILHYGYMQTPNVPSELAACKEKLDLDLKEATYYIEHQLPVQRRRRGAGMVGWRDRLLVFMMRNSPDATASYHIPSDQVVELGLRVRI
jgi:KUP system potassium uptake protein